MLSTLIQSQHWNPSLLELKRTSNTEELKPELTNSPQVMKTEASTPQVRQETPVPTPRPEEPAAVAKQTKQEDEAPKEPAQQTQALEVTESKHEPQPVQSEPLLQSPGTVADASSDKIKAGSPQNNGKHDLDDKDDSEKVLKRKILTIKRHLLLLPKLNNKAKTKNHQNLYKKRPKFLPTQVLKLLELQLINQIQELLHLLKSHQYLLKFHRYLVFQVM